MKEKTEKERKEGNVCEKRIVPLHHDSATPKGSSPAAVADPAGIASGKEREGFKDETPNVSERTNQETDWRWGELNEDDIALIQMALRTRYDKVEEIIRRNTNGELLHQCSMEQAHISDLKRRLFKL